MRQVGAQYRGKPVGLDSYTGYSLAEERPLVSVFKVPDESTALEAPWSLQDYLTWQRAQEERDEVERESANRLVLQRYDPECEAAIRALEEGGWGKGCQERTKSGR